MIGSCTRREYIYGLGPTKLNLRSKNLSYHLEDQSKQINLTYVTPVISWCGIINNYILAFYQNDSQEDDFE